MVDGNIRATEPLKPRLSSVSIERIELEAICRNDTTKVLLGLQALYGNDDTRRQLFALSEQQLGAQVGHSLGRPSINPRCIVVLTAFKQRINLKYPTNIGLLHDATLHCARDDAGSL